MIEVGDLVYHISGGYKGEVVQILTLEQAKNSEYVVMLYDHHYEGAYIKARLGNPFRETEYWIAPEYEWTNEQAYWQNLSEKIQLYYETMEAE